MISAKFVTILGAVESYPVLDTTIKEMAGINAPKIALTRSNTERKDVAISEIGNTMAFGVGGVAVDQFLKQVFKQAQKETATAASQRWATIGRSMGVYSTIFSLMWAMPFVRNYITAKQTGSVSFTDVIKANHKNKPHLHDQKAALGEALDYYRNKALGIIGLGGAATLASAGLAKMAASAKRPVGQKFLDWLFVTSGKGNAQKTLANRLLLKGGEFAGFGGLPALLFWGIPAYGGWLHASRDPYEKKEQWLKFGNFVACFFLPPVVMDKIFKSRFEKHFPQLKTVGYNYHAITSTLKHQKPEMEKALQLWARKNLWSLLSSIVLLGTMPQLINIHLTRKRLIRDQAASAPKPQPATRPQAPASSVQPGFPVLVSGKVPARNLSTGAGLYPMDGYPPFATGYVGGGPFGSQPGWNPSPFSAKMGWPALGYPPVVVPEPQPFVQ